MICWLWMQPIKRQTYTYFTTLLNVN